MQSPLPVLTSTLGVRAWAGSSSERHYSCTSCMSSSAEAEASCIVVQGL